MERSATVQRDGATGTIPRGGQVALRWLQNRKKGEEKKKMSCSMEICQFSFSKFSFSKRVVSTKGARSKWLRSKLIGI